jgi:hypothetical protein
LQKWRSEATGEVREEEDDGGGVGWTVTQPPSFISPSGNLRLISAVHDEVETVELIQLSTCQARGHRGVHYAR